MAYTALHFVLLHCPGLGGRARVDGAWQLGAMRREAKCGEGRRVETIGTAKPIYTSRESDEEVNGERSKGLEKGLLFLAHSYSHTIY